MSMEKNIWRKILKISGYYLNDTNILKNELLNILYSIIVQYRLV